MSKKFRNELEAMSPDQVTEKLGDQYEKISSLLTDKKKKGMLRTMFGVAWCMKKERTAAVQTEAYKKNGLTTINTDDTCPELSAIVKAAEDRGSQSAAKIKKYIDLMSKAEQLAVSNTDSNTGRRAAAKLLIQAFKQLG
jgi:hypothetical protein